MADCVRRRAKPTLIFNKMLETSFSRGWTARNLCVGIRVVIVTENEARVSKSSIIARDTFINIYIFQFMVIGLGSQNSS